MTENWSYVSSKTVNMHILLWKSILDWHKNCPILEYLEDLALCLFTKYTDTAKLSVFFSLYGLGYWTLIFKFRLNGKISFFNYLLMEFIVLQPFPSIKISLKARHLNLFFVHERTFDEKMQNRTYSVSTYISRFRIFFRLLSSIKVAWSLQFLGYLMTLCHIRTLAIHL